MKDSVQACVEAIAENRRIDHVTFSMIFASSQDKTIPYAWSTLPTSWVTRYMRKRYIARDPVVRAGMNATSPFYWADLSCEPGERSVLDDALRYGIGPQGYTLPHVESGTRSLLTFTNRTLAEQDWRYYIDAIYPELRGFVRCLHQKALRELEHEGSPLTSRKSAGATIKS